MTTRATLAALTALAGATPAHSGGRGHGVTPRGTLHRGGVSPAHARSVAPPDVPTDADRPSSTLASGPPLGFPGRLKIATLRRIAAVTLALSAIGVVVGAALGALALWGLLVIEGTRSLLDPAPLLTGAIFGGMLGFVLAPVAAWTLMRHVPLWRAIGETALGTAVGAAAGWVLGPRLGDAMLWAFALGLVGFAAAAMRLRLTYRG